MKTLKELDTELERFESFHLIDFELNDIADMRYLSNQYREMVDRLVEVAQCYAAQAHLVGIKDTMAQEILTELGIGKE